QIPNKFQNINSKGFGISNLEFDWNFEFRISSFIPRPWTISLHPSLIGDANREPRMQPLRAGNRRLAWAVERARRVSGLRPVILGGRTPRFGARCGRDGARLPNSSAGARSRYS